MSFGSLSARAVEALNQGAKLAGCLHNTGEGGVSRYHQAGGDLIWQIGTGYFGCRNAEGEHFEVLGDRFDSITPMELFHYEADWGLPSKEDQEEIQRMMGV